MVARKHFQVSNRRPWPDLQLAWLTAWGCCFSATWYIAEHDKTSLTTISSGSTRPQTLCGISWLQGRENLACLLPILQFISCLLKGDFGSSHCRVHCAVMRRPCSPCFDSHFACQSPITVYSYYCRTTFGLIQCETDSGGNKVHSLQYKFEVLEVTVVATADQDLD